MAAAALLRLYRLGQDSLWFDEIGQVVVAKNSWWTAALSSAQHHGNTPLDYLVTHFTLYVGESEAILRLPSVIWGVLSVIFLYKLAVFLYDHLTGFLAAFLLAIMPLHVYYSQELRFYSLATFMTLLSVYTFLRATEENTGWGWGLYAVVQAFGFYTHYYILVITVLQALWLLWTVRVRLYTRSTILGFATAASLAAVLFLPWIVYDIYYEYVYKQGPLETGFAFRVPSVLAILRSPFFQKGLASAVAKPSTWWTVFAWIAAAIGTVTSLFRGLSRERAGTLLLVLLVVGGGVSVLVLDFIASYFYAPRQFLIYTPLLILLASHGYGDVFRLRIGSTERMQGLAALLPALVVMGLSVWVLGQPLGEVYRAKKTNWRGTVRYLVRNVESDDALVTPMPLHIGFYAPELSSQISRLQDVPSLLRTAESRSRVWVLASDGVLPQHYPEVHQWIGQENAIELSIDPRLRLYLFSVNVQPSELVKQLLQTRAYAPPMFLTSDLMERASEYGYVDEVVVAVLSVLDDEDLEPEEKGLITVRVSRALLEEGAYIEAIEILEQLMLMDSTYPDAWVTLGIAYTHRNMLDAAVSAYEKALEANPGNYWANHLLAGILYGRQQWFDVVSLEARALEFAPRDELRRASLIRMAEAYSSLGRTAEACKSLWRAHMILQDEETLQMIASLGCRDES